MKVSLLLFVLLVVSCKGGPPTPILDAFITGAENIRSQVQNVGSFLDKITRPIGGLNFGGHFEIKHEGHGHTNQLPPNMDNEDQKTVIVIIDKQNNNHQHYGPEQNRFPPQNHVPPPFPNGEPAYPMGPGYHNQPHSCNTNNGLCNHIPDQNNHGNSNNNNQPNESTSTTGPDNESDNNYNDSKQDDKIKTSTEDEPLLVPLNPNDYVYGGDKIEINAPKRETNNSDKSTNDDKKAKNDKKANDEEEEYPIDIRFGNSK